jgi:hypothetical protein
MTAFPYFDILSLTGIGAIFLGTSGDFILLSIVIFPRLKTGLIILAVVFIAYNATLGLRMALLV